MGAISGRTRRHRRHRLAAELYATWTPRRQFTFGTSVGWAHWYDNPDDLYRRRNRLTYTGFSGATSGTPGTAPTAGWAFGATGGSQTVSGTSITFTTVGLARQFFYTPTAVATLAAGESAALSLTVEAVNITAGTSVIAYLAVTSGSASAQTFVQASQGVGRRSCYVTAGSGGCTVEVRLGVGVSANATGTVTVKEPQVDIRTTTATTFQPVPTTWEQAYLDAVGAERIFAWQDSAGTTPVTAVGQSVGLILDRAYGGMRGAEGWADGAVTFSGESSRVSPGVYRVYTSAGAYSAAAISGSMTIGKTYEATFVVDSVTVAGAGVTLEGASVASWTTTGAKRVIFVATGTAFGVKRSGAVLTDIQVSNVSVREIPGTHRIQASAPSRPLLMARVNQMLASETLGSTVWDNATPNLATVSGTLVTAATGGTLSMRRQALTLIGGTALKTLFRLSAGSATQSRLIVRDNTNSTQAQAYLDWSSGVPSLNGASNGTWTISLVGSQYWVVNTFTLGAGASISTLISLYPDSAAGTGTVNCHGVDLRTADDAAKNIPAYQRVGATAADHDTAGFPHYLLYDGTDDSMASVATVDGSGSDKVTVVTGVTKLSDAAAGIIHEHTTTSGNAGSFGTFAPSSPGGNNFRWYGRGVSAGVPEASASGLPAPVSGVFTGSSDLAADSTVARWNGVQTGSSATDCGTGNFANATHYWGSRAGSSVRFNGREYASIGRFGPMSETERNRTEQWTKNWMRMP